MTATTLLVEPVALTVQPAGLALTRQLVSVM
jgi:hypothetical protein